METIPIIQPNYETTPITQTNYETTPIVEQPLPTYWNKTTKICDLDTYQLKCIYLLTFGNIAYYCDEGFANEECYCFGTDICNWYEGCYCCICNSTCGSPIFLWVHCIRNMFNLDYSDFFGYNEYVNLDTGEVEN